MIPSRISLSLFSLLPSSSLTLFPHRLSSFSLPSLLMVYLLLLFSHVLSSSISPSFVTLFSPYPFFPFLLNFHHLLLAFLIRNTGFPIHVPFLPLHPFPYRFLLYLFMYPLLFLLSSLSFPDSLNFL